MSVSATLRRTHDTVRPARRTRPAWVRALRTVVRHLPRGRYRVVSSIHASTPPFVAALANDAGGAFFACDLSDEIAREVCLTGCYEPPVTRLLQRRLRAGGRMVDAGANWGYFSLLAAAAVGPSGTVIALEPDPRQFAMLVSNVELNAFTQVTAMSSAAGARRGSAVLAGYREQAGNRGVSRIESSGESRAASEEPRFTVECVALDEATAQLSDVDVVKIDVEGAELDVLRGMQAGLASGRYRAVLLELHPELLQQRGASPEACLGILLDAGYRGWTIDQSKRTYGRALDPRVRSQDLLRPLDEWRHQPWPHLLWLAQGAEPI